MPLRVLIVGGGPNPKYNQVSIESNAIYVQHLLPASASVRILYADGNAKTKDVQYRDSNGKERYEAAKLTPIDGPALPSSVDEEITRLAKPPPASVLMYFSGHGDPGSGRRAYTNTRYDLWNDGSLSVRHLAADLKALPANDPVTVIMAQCYSGGFGQLIFQDGIRDATLVDRDICGFFASLPHRMAAGCTPQVNQAGYSDFTTYFFAALSGRDRLGHAVTGADYNHDGKVGMDEAFAYALIHDNSIDTPTCTSDYFLRAEIQMPESYLFATPYTQIKSWATPSQLVALTALSGQLKLSGEDRCQQAFNHYSQMDIQSEDTNDVRTYRFVVLAKSIVLAHQLETIGDYAVKARYAALKAHEAMNPLR